MKDDEKSYSKRILDFIEKDRFSLTSAVVYVFIISVIRSFLEAYISGYGAYTLNIIAQHVLISYPEILMGALVVYAITKIHIRKIWNVILLGFWILILPPLIDLFIFGKSGTVLIDEYSYQNVENILALLLNLWNPFYLSKYGSNGLLIMFYGMMIGTASYVALRLDLPSKIVDSFSDISNVKGLVKTFGKVVLSFFGIGVVTWSIGSFSLILRIGKKGVILFNNYTLPYYTKYYRFFESHNYDYYQIYPQPNSGVIGLIESLAFQQRNLLMSSFFIILTIIFTFISLYTNYRKHLNIMLKNIKKLRYLLFTICGFLGVASVHLIDPAYVKGLSINPFYILHFPYVFFLVISIMLVVAFDDLIDQIFAFNRDEERDNPISDGIVPKYHYKHLALAFALTAIFLSFVLGWITFFICLFWILTSVFYRWLVGSKKDGVFLGLYGVLAMVMGVYTPGEWKALIMEYEGGEFIYSSKEYISRVPSINFEMILIAIWIFLALAMFNYFKKVLENEDIDDSIYKKSIIYIVTVSLIMMPVYLRTDILSILLFSCAAIGTIIWFKIIKTTIVLKIGFIFTATILFSLLI
ncbi:MAG: hypothetical protein R6U61_01250 [Thermoplasmata archaeon]